MDWSGFDPEEEQRLRIEFGRRFRDARRQSGLTQAQVAAKVGITQTYVSYVERGLRNVTFPVAAALARAVGYRFDPVLRRIAGGRPTKIT